MRRSSNRKSSSASATATATAGSTKATTKEFEKIDQLFHVYADKASGTIDPEGIEQLCSSLGVDYTDVRILMLAWKMRAQNQGFFTLEEWRTGLKALRADSISKLKKALPELVKEVSRPTDFLDFYSYAFRYCLTEDKQKCIDIESACQLLSLVLGSQFGPQVDKFTEYLKCQSEYKVINMDQWMGFYRFCNEIPFPSLENYDADLAWPLILDNFVEWFREIQKKLQRIVKNEDDKHFFFKIGFILVSGALRDIQNDPYILHFPYNLMAFLCKNVSIVYYFDTYKFLINFMVPVSLFFFIIIMVIMMSNYSKKKCSYLFYGLNQTV